MPRVEIVLARHGETEWSRDKLHTSHTDLPLTDVGRQEALALASRLEGRDFALVLTSPLRRARETCELAGLADRAVIDDDLREFEYGEFEGVSTKDIRAMRPWLIRRAKAAIR